MSVLLITVKKGTSLIELMVVLTILMILMAIMFPVYVRALAYAKGGVCTSNLSQIQKALMIYANEHDGAFPPNFAPLRLPSEVTRCKGGGEFAILWHTPQNRSNPILVVDPNRTTHHERVLGVFADGNVERRGGEGDPLDPAFWR